MLIDVHAHYAPRRLAEAHIRQGSEIAQRLMIHPNTDDAGDIAERLGLMDDAGVQMQVLSAAGLTAYGPDEARSVELTRLGNEEFADLARRRPDRFKWLVSLPLPHIDASLRELEQGLGDLHASGVHLGPFVLERSITEPRFEPLFAELDRRGAVLFFHPVQNGVCSPLINDYKLTTAIGAPTEDGVLVTHLIAAQIPARFPNIRIIVSHLGGAIPVILNRLDNLMPRTYPQLLEKPSETARRLYYDSVSHGSPAALAAASKAFGPERILPGSDYPVLLKFESYRETFDYIRRSGLPPDDVELILERTAPTLFDLPPAD